MRAQEFIVIEDRKKLHGYRQAIYGPGPYGWYGFNSGYSGDGGSGEGGIEENDNTPTEDAGSEWEEAVMDRWSPKASRYMARIVKQSFNSLYPDVKLKVWAEDEGVSATTDLASNNVKADVFGQYGKKDWECNFLCGPLFYRADGHKYLELMVDDASSGSYPGVWKIIISEWKKYALSQLKKTGADDICFSVDQDMSGGAWGKIAQAVGIKFIAHDLDEGFRRQVKNLSEGQVTNTIMAFALVGGLILGSGAGYIKYTQKERWKEAYTQIKEQDPETAKQIQAMVNRYMSKAHRNPIDAYIDSKAIDKAITDFENKNLNKQPSTPQHFADGRDLKNSGAITLEGINDPAIFKAIFLVGGPGSGKSSVSELLGLRSLGYTPVNSDIAFEYLMKKYDLDPKMPLSQQGQRDQIRTRAKDITANKSNLALDGRLGLIFDGTGDNFEKIADLKKNVESLGYSCYLVIVNTDLQVARDRNMRRTRTVPDEIAIGKWQALQNNIGKYTEIFNNLSIIDHSYDLKDPRYRKETLPQIQTAYKKIVKFTNMPNKNPKALAWSNQQQKKDELLAELKYKGNIGVMELVKFFKEHPELKQEYNRIKMNDGSAAALKFALKVINAELEGEPFA